jgi:tetraacyldisaccharide 4'-kinase
MMARWLSPDRLDWMWKPGPELSLPGALLRLPLSLLAGANGGLMRARAAAYQKGWLPSRRLPAKVAAVGNLTVGGSGKTPLARWLAARLSAEGRRVALISRGYRRASAAPVTVASRGDGPLGSALELGDEPYWLAQNLPGVPVLCGPDRVRVGEQAIAQFRATHLVLDDGFQHLRLKRDADVVVVDGRRPPASEALLPRGRLREPWSALHRAAVVVVNKVSRPDPAWTEWLSRWNPEAPVFFSRYQPVGIFSLAGEPAEDKGPALAFAGLAEPDYFFELLAGQVQVKDRVAFPDHHSYSAAELEELAARAKAAGAERMITTEKDAGRLAGLGLPALPIHSLRVALDFFGRENDCYAAIRSRLEGKGAEPKAPSGA